MKHNRLQTTTKREGKRAVQDTGEIARDPAMNPVVEIHKNDDVIIEEYVQRQGGIGLDWYVPDFANTQVKTLIRERVKCATQRGRILFTCPPIKRILPHINLRVRSSNRMHLHIPHPTRGHRHPMPTRGIRSRTVSKKIPK